MFCEKCGAPVEAGKTICDACAAKEAAGQEQKSGIELDQAQQPSQKKTGLLIGIVAAAAALLVIAIVLCMGPLKGLWLKSFGTPADYMLFVEEKSTASAVESFVQAYADSMKQVDGMQEYTTDGTAHILIGDQLLTLLEQSLATQGMAMELDFLKDISMDIQGSFDQDEMDCKIGLGLGDKQIVDMVMYLNDGSKSACMGIPSLSSQYVQVALDNAVLYSPSKSYEHFKLLPDAAELGAVLNTYTGIARKYLSRVEMNTETVIVDGVSQELTVLTLTVTAEEVSSMIEEVLETAKTDQDLEAVLDDFSAYVNATMRQQYGDEYDDYFEDVDLHQEMLDALPGVIDEIRDSADELTDGDYLQLVDYVDSKHAIRGRKLEVFTDNVSEGSLHYLNITDGSQYAMELDMTEIPDVALYIGGTYTDEEGTVNGTFDIEVQDVTYATLKVENSTKYSTHVKLMPTDAFMRGVLQLEDSASALLGLASPYLEIISNVDEDATTAEMEFYLKAGETMLAGITMDATYSKSASITPPQGPFVDAEDDAALEQWVSQLDVNKLMDNLVAAGVPEQLILSLFGQLAG